LVVFVLDADLAPDAAEAGESVLVISPPLPPERREALQLTIPGAVWLEAPMETSGLAEALTWVRSGVLPHLRARAGRLEVRLVVQSASQSLAQALAQALSEPAAGPKALAAAPAPAAPPPPPPPRAHRLLPELDAELRRAAQRDGPLGERTLEARRQFLTHPQATEAKADQIVGLGVELQRALTGLHDAAGRFGPESSKARNAHESVKRRFPRFLAEVARALRAGGAVARRRAEAAQVRAAGLPLSSVRPSEQPHALQQLVPHPSWVLLIDETGAALGAEPASEPHPRGRFVGLLLMEPSTLPPIPLASASADAPADVDRHLQALLDRPVGVLGLPTDGLPQRRSDLWCTGVVELVEWTLRLMPMVGPTKLEVRIEPRGASRERALDAQLAELRRQLAERSPERHAGLTLQLRYFTRADEPRMGYTDALAFTWASPSPRAEARLAQSGLLGTCLVDGDTEALRRTWDALHLGEPLSGATWRAALGSADARRPSTFAAELLAELGARARVDRALWTRCCGAAVAHLDRLDTELAALGAEAAWLDRYRPEGQPLPATLQLAWAAARLASASEDEAAETELRSSCDALLDEAPALVCQVELGLAARAAERFDFWAATRALARWRDLPPSVAGLCGWGRLHRALGHHAASRGDWDAALVGFDGALTAFGRLSDAAISKREWAETAACLALAAMDDPRASPALVRERVGAVLSLALPDIEALAGSSAPELQLMHHLLVRYLVQRGTAEERQAYCRAPERWAIGEGQPWPLIQLHRALLLRPVDPAEAREHLEVALSLLPEPGWLGLCLATLARAWSTPVADPVDEPALRARLPLAPWSVLDAARDQASALDPLEVLPRLLPFRCR
jgi:hypothetical protein